MKALLVAMILTITVVGGMMAFNAAQDTMQNLQTTKANAYYLAQ
jgi:nitrate/TMAO reductase-like tetraheme cytochrome c subunit